MPTDPHEIAWFFDEDGHPQQATRSNASQNHPDWKPMSDKDFAKTFPDHGDESENTEE